MQIGRPARYTSAGARGGSQRNTVGSAALSIAQPQYAARAPAVLQRRARRNEAPARGGGTGC
eukprot:11178310-Lingulodinium_polyedra.AAC.1